MVFVVKCVVLLIFVWGFFYYYIENIFVKYDLCIGFFVCWMLYFVYNNELMYY